MKKLIALLLALVMVLGMVACGEKAPAETNAPAKEENKPAATQAATETPDWKVEHPTWLCEEKTTLTVYTWEGVSSSFLPPSNDLFFWQYMEEYTNVHIEWEVVPYADFNTLIAAKLSSGDALNDIIMMGQSAQTPLGAGQNGMLVDLAPNWESWFPNMDAMYKDMNVPYKANISNYDGSMYAITTFAAPMYNRIILLFNTQWMKALNLEIPETIDELEAVLRAMKAAGDLNGNGQADEIYFTATDVEWLLPSIGTAFGVENIESCDFFSAGADGVVYDEYTSENMKAMLGWLNEMYDEGILDAEIATNTMDIVAEKVTADRVGVVSMYASFATSYGNLTTAGQNDKNAEYYSLGKVMTSQWNPTPKMTMYENYSMFTGISTNCANPELAARWIDTLYADPEILVVRACGEPGNTFEFDANGDPQIIMPADGSAWTNKNLGCGQLSLPYIQTDLQLNFSKAATAPWYVEDYEANFINGCEWNMPSVPKVPGYTEEETEIRDLYQADLKSAWEEYRNKFIIGELDVEADWAAYAATLKGFGLDEMRDCYQSVYDRTR